MARKTDPVRHCPVCGTQLERKRYGKNLEDRTRFLSRKTCGQSCGNTKVEVTKDALHWRARKHRASECNECASPNDLHVHHIDRNPANNDPSNLQTLCASCHLTRHWAEDRETRVAAAPRRVPQACVVCQNQFHPRKARTQTCSEPCKAALLSRRTSQHYATARRSARTDQPSTAGS